MNTLDDYRKNVLNNDLVRIRAMIDDGIVRSEVDGQNVTFRALSDLERIEARKLRLLRDIDLATKPRAFRIQTDSGIW